MESAVLSLYAGRRGLKMHFTTFLKKHFDIEIHTILEKNQSDLSDAGCAVYQIWLYEKGEDSEPLLILNRFNPAGETAFIVGNVYSSLKHGLVVTEQEFRKMVKSGEVIK